MKRNLHIEYRPIASVTPYVRNARTHSNNQVNQIAKSIKAIGFINPVLVDKDGGLVAGHARVLAAKQLGLDIIPTICLEHLSEAEKRAYILADNKLAENAGWDEDLLRIELDFLTNFEIDFDLDQIGFTTTEVDLLLGNDVVPSSDDEVPSLTVIGAAISQPGDLWVLGPNRIIVGDCRDENTIDKLMEGVMAQMVLSDPPYNVPISGHVSGLGKVQHREFPVASGEMAPAEFTLFLTDAFRQLARVSADGSLHYLFMDWRHMKEIIQAGEAIYDRLMNLVCWLKSNAGMGSLYRSQHELIFVFKYGTSSHINNVELGKNGRYRTNVWEYSGSNSFGKDRDESLSWHPTVKPVQLLADAILDTTHLGEIVLDGFLGSGSTLIAAERTGRVCFGVELDPGYVDVTIARWESITGERAFLAGTDLNIDQVAAERGIQRGVAV